MQLRVAIALDDLRRDRGRLQLEPPADGGLDRRRQVREGADGAGNLADADDLARAAQARQVALQLGIPERQLQAERHRLGVHAVRAFDFGHVDVDSSSTLSSSARQHAAGRRTHFTLEVVWAFDGVSACARPAFELGRDLLREVALVDRDIGTGGERNRPPRSPPQPRPTPPIRKVAVSRAPPVYVRLLRHSGIPRAVSVSPIAFLSYLR